MDSLFSDFSVLVGFGALIAATVNILKQFNVVPDGSANQVTTALSLLGVVSLFVLRTVWGIELVSFDAQAGSLAQMLVALGSFAAMTITARQTHQAFRGLPLVGYSHRNEEMKKIEAALNV